MGHQEGSSDVWGGRANGEGAHGFRAPVALWFSVWVRLCAE